MMATPTISVTFLGELNDFLPRAQRNQPTTLPITGLGSVKDTIEGLGVPHPEVAHIVVNGAAVEFSYVVQSGDEIVAYPLSMTGAAALPLRPRPAARFVLDVHLGRLAEHLRLLGFDTLYRNDYDDPTLARISATDDRILLTRDVGLLKRGIVTHGIYVRHTEPQRQVIEILTRFDLFGEVAPFKRCSRCNGLLQPVAKERIADQLHPATLAQHHTFQQCQSCGQIYWQGSHVGRMQQFIAEIVQHDPRRAQP